jgi:hypothetical protein
LLGEVVRRGEWMRRRRRLTTGLGSGIAVLLAVAGVAAVAGSGDGTPTQLAAGGPTTTINQSLQATGGTTFAVDAPTTTTPAAELPTLTTAAPGVTTSAPVAPATTDPTTAPTLAPVTTVPGPLQPRCSPAEMEATLTFSQPTYRAGQQAVGQGVLRNRSGAPCYYYSYTQSQEFKNAAGVAVAPGSALIADAFADTAFAPGQTLAAAPTWDLTLCATNPACPPAPPGTYTATVSWSFDGPPISATATFQVVP